MLKLVLHAIFIVAALISFLYLHDKKSNMRNALIREVALSNGRDAAINVGWYSADRIDKLCLQTPYMTQKYFEDAVGSNVQNFKEIDGEDIIILWVFPLSGAPTQIEFNRWNELGHVKQRKICESTSVIRVNEYKAYFDEER
jgi:hypothetical protein